MNAINWFEIPTADLPRATRFYEQVLARSLVQERGFPDMPMALFPCEGSAGVGGCLCQHPECRPHADGVRVYLNAGEDLTPALARVPEAGGQVVVPKTLIREDIGYFAMFRDLDGNIIGLHSLH